MEQRLHDGQNGISDESLAYYAGALRERPQSVHWLARVVADYFKVACKVEQFVGQWFELPRTERTTLAGANCELGVSSFCGARIWDRTTRVRLLIGPLRKAQFDDLLPGRSGAISMERLFKLMLGPGHDCEIRLILDRRELVQANLDSRNGNGKLGWNGWLGKRTADNDSHEVAYLIGAPNKQS
jgi:type VI secretion system protein ImpH